MLANLAAIFITVLLPFAIGYALAVWKERDNTLTAEELEQAEKQSAQEVS